MTELHLSVNILERSHSEVPTYYQGKKRKGKKGKAYKPTVLQG